MNTLPLMVLVLSLLSSVLYFAKATFEELGQSSHAFKEQRSGCSSTPEDYWEQSYSSNCIPPPSDAETSWIPRRAGPPALCLFVRALENAKILNSPIKSPTGEALSCSYL